MGLLHFLSEHRSGWVKDTQVTSCYLDCLSEDSISWSWDAPLALGRGHSSTHQAYIVEQYEKSNLKFEDGGKILWRAVNLWGDFPVVSLLLSWLPGLP